MNLLLHRPLVVSGILALGGLFAGAAAGQTTVPNSFDADSYTHFGINNAFSPELTVGVDLSETGIYHFNFGVVAFDDLSALASGGEKYLRFEIEAYAVTEIVDGFPVTSLSGDGQASLKVVALGLGYDDYLAASDKPGWFDTHVGGIPAIAEGSFSGTGVFDLDVTSSVDGWLADPSSNHGFALVLTSGDPIEMGASEGGNGAVLSDTPWVPPVAGDLDGDGDVDGVDLGLFFANFTGPDSGPAADPSADLDADGDVDGVDLAQAFAAFTGPLAPSVVPEPAGAMVITLLAPFMLQRRRQKNRV